jgi:hypothetical protein
LVATAKYRPSDDGEQQQICIGAVSVVESVKMNRLINCAGLNLCKINMLSLAQITNEFFQRS